MEIVYQTLMSELKRKRIKLHTVSVALGITDKSLYNKLRGATSFTWDEVSLIRNIWFAEMSSDELFARSQGEEV